jgi:protein involved in temperature-dependent protein secretion
MPRDLGSPSQRLNSAANLARAAAGAGEMATYREGLELADRILADPRAQPRAADALLTLGRAALLSGDWDLADHFAERAARLARERGEGVAALQVEAVVEAIRAERLAGSAPKPVRDVPRAVEELAAELSAALAPLGGR